MKLPLPAHESIIPIIQYSPDSPPVMFNIPNVLQHVVYLIPNIISAVVNEAGMKANLNPIRRFAYNMLANNFWQNQEMYDVVKHVADSMCLNLKKQLYRTLEASLSDSVDKVLSMYSSNLMFQYPELKSMVCQRTIDSAITNVGIFNNFKQECQAMMNTGHGNMYDPRMQQQQLQVPPGYTLLSDGSMVPTNRLQQQPMMNTQQQVPQGYQMLPNGQIIPMQQMPQNMGGVYNPMLNQAVVGNNNSAWGNNSFNTNVNEPTVVGAINDRFASRTESYHRPPVQQQYVQNVVEEEVEINHELTIEGGTEMDRSKHTIAIVGNSYEVKSEERAKIFTKSSNELSKVQNIDEDDDDSLSKQYLYPNALFDTSLDSAILNGRSKQISIQKDKAFKQVFRSFNIITSPILSNTSVKAYVEAIKESSTLADIALKITSIGQSLSIVSKSETKSEEDINKAESAAIFLNQIDILLTEVINDFFKNKIGLELRIDSFSEDISDIPDYLRTKYGINYIKAYNAFEEELLSILFLEHDKSLVDSIMSDIQETIDIDNIGIIPINYSITYVPLTNKELGYNVEQDSVFIDRSNTPTLYKLAKSLINHKKLIDLNTVYDLLITSDGCIYKLYKSYVNTDMFLISK